MSANRLATLRAGGEALHQPFLGGFALGIETADVGGVPLAHHDGHEDLVVVDLQVVDAGLGDQRRMLVEVGDPDAGMANLRTCFSRAIIISFGAASKAAAARSR